MSMQDDPIAEAWEELVAEWDDEKAHKRFLTLCEGLDRLADAGTRYRAIKEDEPERAEMADQQIDRLLGLAMGKLSVLKTDYNPRSTKSMMTLVAMGVSGALIVWTFYGLLRSM